MQVIIINGSGGKGKDEFVKMCRKYCSVYNFSSVDKVKKAARILGWEEKKEEIDRKFLSDLKFLSSKYNNSPLTYMKNMYQECLKNPRDLLFFHIREPKEIEEAKQVFNAKTLLIKNSNVKDIKTNEADANVENYEYDYVIDNSGDLNRLDQQAGIYTYGFIKGDD